MKYAFVEEHRPLFSIRAMCRCLRVHPSGFYAWLRNPLSKRAIEDQRQTKLIKEAWEESGKVYGYRKLHDDLCPSRALLRTPLPGSGSRRDLLPEPCGAFGTISGYIKAQIGYKRRPGMYGRKPSIIVDNTLNRQFDVDTPGRFCLLGDIYHLTGNR